MTFELGPKQRAMLAAVVVGSSVIVVLALLFRMVAIVGGHPIPFDTDEADHANAALELYRSFPRGPTAFFEAVTRQSFYPPVNSFLVCLTYLILGPGITPSRISSIAQFAIFLGVLFHLVRTELVGRSGSDRDRVIAGACASFALLLAAVCPVIVVNSLLVMIEPTGLLLITTLLLYLGGHERRGSAAGAIALAGLLALIFLTKYSFGIVVIPAVLGAALLDPDRRWRDRFRRASLLGLVTLGFVVAWVLATDHRSLWHFLVGHPSYVPLLSAENLIFYIRSWLFEYFASPALAVLVALLILAALRSWRASLRSRTAFLIVVSALGVLTISTTNEVRHLLVIIPGALYLAALGLFDLMSNAAGRRRGWAAAGAGLVVLALVAHGSWMVAAIDPRAVRAFEGEPEYLALQTFILDNVDPTEPVLVAGAFDSFSLESIRYLAALRTGSRYTDVRIDGFPFDAKRNREARLRGRNVARPFVDGSVPSDVAGALHSGYYRFAVQIDDLRAASVEPPDEPSILALLGDRPHRQMFAADVRVTVLAFDSLSARSTTAMAPPALGVMAAPESGSAAAPVPPAGPARPH